MQLLVAGQPTPSPTRWRGPGPEVLLALDRTSTEALWQQVQRQLRDSIRSGRLAPGERLPSSRELARQLGVSRGVVVASYDQLHAEGYLSTRPAAAVEVARSVAAAAPPPAPPPRPTPHLDIDFEYGVPDLGRFPRGDWAWALGEACRAATDEDLGDERAGGSRELRTVLAAYARRVRASRVDPDHLVVVPAFRHGLHVVDVPVDVDGIDVAQLARSGARAVVVTPASSMTKPSTSRAQASIDEYRFAITPVALGAGTDLFPPGTTRMAFERRDVRLFDSGIVEVRCTRRADSMTPSAIAEQAGARPRRRQRGAWTVSAPPRDHVDGPRAAVDAVGRYDDSAGGMTVVASCDLYEFVGDEISAITSHAVEIGEPG